MSPLSMAKGIIVLTLAMHSSAKLHFFQYLSFVRVISLITNRKYVVFYISQVSQSPDNHNLYPLDKNEPYDVINVCEIQSVSVPAGRTICSLAQFTDSLVGPYLVQKRIWYKCTIFGRIWYKCTIFGPNMVQFSTEYGTNIVPYSIGISFSMLAKTYLVHTKKTHKMKMAYVYGT